MVYEFNGTPCDGYTTTFRFVTRISTQDVARLTDQQTTTYEGGDGKSLDFVTKSYVDRVLDTETKGRATIKDGATHVELQKPVQRSLDLEKTRFPTEHLVDLIERAKRGETFYETTLFDGSDDADKVMTTTVVIGKKQQLGSDDPEAKALGPIADQPFWPVDIAYFDLSEGNGEELPSYRISFKLYENGITRDLVMDYGDFSMTGRLVDLAMLDSANTCAK